MLRVPPELEATQTLFNILLADIDGRLQDLEGEPRQRLGALQRYVRGEIGDPTGTEVTQLKRALADLEPHSSLGAQLPTWSGLQALNARVREYGADTFAGAGGRGIHLDVELRKLTGQGYEVISPDPQFYEATPDRPWQDAAAHLQAGRPVPVRTGTSEAESHYMLMTAVRGEPPDRQFLVANPMDGGTQWLSQEELAITVQDMYFRLP